MHGVEWWRSIFNLVEFGGDLGEKMSKEERRRSSAGSSATGLVWEGKMEKKRREGLI